MTHNSLLVHLVRHGRVASHRGDVPVTQAGMREVEAAGRRFGAQLQDGELVSVLYTATLRSRETALALHRSMSSALGGRPGLELLPPAEEPAIRNPDIYIGGLRVEMVSTPEAMAEQTELVGIGAEQVARLPFYRNFFPSPDRIGYWVRHPNPPGENAEAVARRLMTWSLSLRQLPSERPRRYICVTHSPLLRALLRHYLMDEDPGEPDFVESIDMSIPSGGSLTLCYRGEERTIEPSTPSGLPER
jgi:broad specificity phosphatase PhoE